MGLKGVSPLIPERLSVALAVQSEHDDVGSMRVEGLPLSWRDVQVTLAGNLALRGVSGDIAAGSLVAVMGPSGSGKTTLLNALSRRGLVSSGEIRYGNQLWNQSLKRKVAMVEQDDHVFAELTVGESLRYAAALRLHSLSPAAREARVQAVMATLRLTRVANSRVGDTSAIETRGVSGGERKRLCIAMELLTLPKLLFCDEITSGLDASMAFVAIEVLRDLASVTGLTIVTTIHQPSSKVFQLFDRLLLLNAGAAVFHGPVSTAAERFAALGHPCPAGYNHADWLLEVLVMGLLSPEQAASLREECGPASVKPFRSVAESSATKVGRGVRAPWSYQLAILFRRGWRVSRTSLWSYQEAVLQVGMGLLAGLVYYRLGYEADDVKKRSNACFSLGVQWMFFPMCAAMYMLPGGEALLRKELSVGAYSLSANFIATNILVLPSQLLMASIHVTVFYWLAGIADDVAAFVLTYLGIVLLIVTFHSLGVLMSVLPIPPPARQTASFLIMNFCVTFGGVTVEYDHMTLAWLRFTNPLYWAENLLAQAVFLEGKTYSTSGSGEPTSRAQALAERSMDVPAASCVAVLMGLTVLAQLSALLLQNRRLRRVLLVQQDVQSMQPAGGATSGGAARSSCRYSS
mmetsp:Transcript_66018/g.175785  ORF Transcript_66018/g.175785 Transcript_66018/m.175785 type:complete len:632 (+) Transcript_66018:111-2006(+)